jgi:hypothetical protein
VRRGDSENARADPRRQAGLPRRWLAHRRPHRHLTKLGTRAYTNSDRIIPCEPWPRNGRRLLIVSASCPIAHHAAHPPIDLASLAVAATVRSRSRPPPRNPESRRDRPERVHPQHLVRSFITSIKQAKTVDRAVIEHPPGAETQWEWVELPDPPVGWGLGKSAYSVDRGATTADCGTFSTWPPFPASKTTAHHENSMRKQSERQRHTRGIIALSRRLVNVLWALLRDNRTWQTQPPTPLPATAD